MIPLRVSLKDFLCYEKQEFQFDGHAVWLLHGNNGVGKSAVFDAMVYALFGEYKRSAVPTSATDLIRHGANSFRVEFDFEYNRKRYRIWRTRARSGPTKQGVSEFVDGNPVPVQHVNLVKEVDKWVTHTLGLNDDAFCSAILLRQGAAEKLIDADKDTRRGLFRGIIDLEPYIRLHKAVTEAKTDINADVRSKRAALEAMPDPTDEQVASAQQDQVTAQSAWEKARSDEKAAQDRLRHAGRWKELDQACRTLRQLLADAAGRIARSAELERAVARLRELRLVVPALQAMTQRHRELETAQKEGERLAAELKTVENEHTATVSAMEQDQQKAAAHHQRIGELTHQITTSENDHRQLTEQIERAKKAQKLHEELSQRRTELAGYEPDLDAACDRSETALTAAQAAKDVISHLETITRWRTDHQRACVDVQAATDAEKQAASEKEKRTTAEAEARRVVDEANRNQDARKQELAVAEDRLATATGAQEQFTTLDGAAKCSLCGQEITGEHAARERWEREQAVQKAQASVGQRRRELEEVNVAAANAHKTWQQCFDQLEEAKTKHRDWGTHRQQAQQRRSDAESGFTNTLVDVPDSLRPRVAAIQVEGFPADTDLQEYRQLRDQFQERKDERDRLRKRCELRNKCAGEIGTLKKFVDAGGAPEDVSAARAQVARLAQVLAEVRKQRSAAESDHQAATDAASKLKTTSGRLLETLSDLKGRVGGAKATVLNTRTRLEEAVDKVPEGYRQPQAFPMADLSVELQQLESSSVEREHKTLDQDRALDVERRQQLEKTERQITDIPPDARRPVAEVQAEVNLAEQVFRAADANRTTTTTKLDTLRRQQTEHETAVQELAQKEHQLTLHERLAELLGDRYIQLDVERDAERQIITMANEVLQRVSAGGLRFDPPDPTSDRSFDITVQRMDCPGSIPVGNLSGGQRFRVAVSLALAVGRFANGQHRPLESVIIDEGFGSLDRDGRMAMITELRDGQALSAMFKKVIVVSHQEDFAAAFPRGYRLWLAEGTTKVEPFGVL